MSDSLLIWERLPFSCGAARPRLYRWSLHWTKLEAWIKISYWAGRRIAWLINWLIQANELIKSKTMIEMIISLSKLMLIKFGSLFSSKSPTSYAKFFSSSLSHLFIGVTNKYGNSRLDMGSKWVKRWRECVRDGPQGKYGKSDHSQSWKYLKLTESPFWQPMCG